MVDEDRGDIEDLKTNSENKIKEDNNDIDLSEKRILNTSDEVYNDQDSFIIENINKKNLSKGALSITVLNYIILFGDAIISFITPAFLSLDEIGVYRALYNYIPLVSLFIYLGMKNTAIKYITLYDNHKEYSKSSAVVYFITFLNTSISLVLMIIFITFSKQLSIFLENTDIYSNYVCLLAVQFIFVPIMVFNQFFVSRYKFKIYFIGNFSGNFLRIILMVYFLFRGYKIYSYLYSGIIGQAVIFVFLLINIFLHYRKPDFSISFKELIKFAMPLFISNIFLYIKNYFYGIILVKFIMNNAIVGLFSYIRIIFNAVLIIFNSLTNVLTIYYAKIIYNKNNKENYYKTTFEFSKIFIFLAMLIGLVFMILSPLYIKIITTLFNQDLLFSIGTITMFLLSFYFIINMFYYIAPTIINIHRTSYKLLEIHGKSVIVYLISYLVFIYMFGMVGIPIGLILGFLSFIVFCYLDIKKQGYRIGFDRSSLKKIIVISVPIIIIVIVEYFINLNDTSILHINLGFYIFSLPRQTLFLDIGLLGIAIIISLFILREIRYFNKSDRGFIEQMLGKKFASVLIKILIKD